MYRIPTATRPWHTLLATLLLLAGTLLLATGSSAAVAMKRTYPNVPLVNQDGETLHFYDDVIKGKVVTINFMFTSCPDTCPLETAKLREVQRLLGEHAGKDVYMYSISVDPARDTPEALKAYMKKFNVGPGWQFLTGKKQDIDLIREQLGMYNDDEEELSDHNINFIMGNEATGRWLKRTPFDVPESLVAALLGRLQPRSLLASFGRPDYSKTNKMGAYLTGEELFITRCTACHTIGQGEKMGPDLHNVVANRDRAWLRRWLKNPDGMLQAKDPLAMSLYEQYGQVPMPNMQLTDDNVSDLITFMEKASKRVADAAGAPGQALETITGNEATHDHSQHPHVH